VLEIFWLVKGEGVFLPRAHRRSIVGNFKRCQVRLKPQKEFQRRFLEDFVGYGSLLPLRRATRPWALARPAFLAPPSDSRAPK